SQDGVQTVLQHPHDGDGQAEEEGGALHQPLGQPLGVAAHQEEVALQVHKLVDPERIERWSLRRDRGGQLIFLLPHGWGGCRPPSRRASTTRGATRPEGACRPTSVARPRSWCATTASWCAGSARAAACGTSRICSPWTSASAGPSRP